MNIDLFFASEYFFKILMKNDDKNNRVINQIFKSTSAITDPNISLIKKPKETAFSFPDRTSEKDYTIKKRSSRFRRSRSYS